MSGEEKVSAPPRFGALANEPGLVPSRRLEGFAAPRSGRVLVDIVSSSLGDGTDAEILGALPYAGANRIRFYGCFSAVLGTAPRACGECNRGHVQGKLSSGFPVRAAVFAAVTGAFGARQPARRRRSHNRLEPPACNANCVPTQAELDALEAFQLFSGRQKNRTRPRSASATLRRPQAGTRRWAARNARCVTAI